MVRQTQTVSVLHSYLSYDFMAFLACSCCQNEVSQQLPSIQNTQLATPQLQQKSLNNDCCNVSNLIVGNISNASQMSATSSTSLSFTSNTSDLISGIRRRHSLASCVSNVCGQSNFGHQCSSVFSNATNNNTYNCCDEIFENSNIPNDPPRPIQIDPSDPSSMLVVF